MPFSDCRFLRKFRPNPNFNMGFGTLVTLFKSDSQRNGRNLLFHCLLHYFLHDQWRLLSEDGNKLRSQKDGNLKSRNISITVLVSFHFYLSPWSLISIREFWSQHMHFCTLSTKCTVCTGNQLFLNLAAVKVHIPLVYKQEDFCDGLNSLLTEKEEISTMKYQLVSLF
jgi:hypothetical protein